MAKTARDQLPRLFEIADALGRRKHYRRWLSNFEKAVAEEPLKLEFFRQIEHDFAALDPAAWIFLKAEMIARGHRWDAARGWEAMLDVANEARAYAYLQCLGCSDIAFVSPSILQKTPDLRATLAGTGVVCEVKTLNIMEAEARARRGIVARDIERKLPPVFFRKMRTRFDKAIAQMMACDSGGAAYCIIYAVINFNDLLHEYMADYMEQIRLELATWPAANVEYVFDVKPPFHSAAADGPSGSRFVFTRARVWKPLGPRTEKA